MEARAHWMLENNTENVLPKIICPLACSLKKALIAGMYDSSNNSRVRRRGENVMGKIASAIVAVTLLTSPLLLPVYYAPEPVYVEEPACRLVRERYWDGYGWQFRRVQVCD